jgi:hypothetical protein
VSMTASPRKGETFIDRMVEKTLGRTDIAPKRGQNYNYPLRWYATPNGDIVQLQSDPQNRALYADLGFHLLATVAARGEELSEVDEWERIERPKVIAEQRKRAKLINAIRKADQKDPTLGTLIDIETIDSQSTEELEDTIKEIRAKGGVVRVTEPKFRDEPEPSLLRGVETARASSLEDLQRKLGADGAQATTIEGAHTQTIPNNGYDPLEQSRRARSRS